MEVGRHLGADPTITSHSLVLSKWSGCPPHNLVTEAHVLVMGQWFCKKIGKLIFQRDMLNFDEPFFNVVMEVKKAHRNMLGPMDESCGPIGPLQYTRHCPHKYGRQLEVS